MIHIYYKDNNSKLIKEVINTLGGCKKIDISDASTLEDSNIYFVEINNFDKDVLLHIKKLLIDKKRSLIYFFITDSQNLMVFQLASLLKVSSVITPKQTPDKIVQIIKKNILEKESLIKDTKIARMLTQESSFMIFSAKKLVFASQKLYNDFDCKDLNMVQSQLCSLFDLNKFLENDIQIEDKSFKIISKTSLINDEKFIFIEKVLNNKAEQKYPIDFIQNRIYFIEKLKEKVLENTILSKELGVITLAIENIDKLREELKEYEIEMSVRDLLFKVALEIDSNATVAQYDDDLYVILCDKASFEELKEKASTIQKKIISYTNTQTIKPIVGLYVFDIKDVELNTILQIISKISIEKINSKDIQNYKIHKIIDINSNLDDSRIIDMLLQTIFTNKNEIKLLNIYKGLCINTPSLITQKTDQEIYVTFKQLQGTAIHFEKETIMQSSSFPKDIIADVKYIDFYKKTVQLNNFKFVQGNANARKYSRVTCANRVPVSIKYDKGTMNGHILDISMNSIAIQTRIYKNMDGLKVSKILLNFTLPSNKNDLGYVHFSLEAKVIFTIIAGDHCKLIVNLFENKDSESNLMEYVYDRQKDIIVELKKHTILISEAQ